MWVLVLGLGLRSPSLFFPYMVHFTKFLCVGGPHDRYNELRGHLQSAFTKPMLASSGGNFTGVEPTYLAVAALAVDFLHNLFRDEIVGLQGEVALFEVLQPLAHQEVDREVPFVCVPAVGNRGGSETNEVDV